MLSLREIAGDLTLKLIPTRDGVWQANRRRGRYPLVRDTYGASIELLRGELGRRSVGVGLVPTRSNVPVGALTLCAGHVRQLWGESPLVNLMEVKA